MFYLVSNSHFPQIKTFILEERRASLDSGSESHGIGKDSCHSYGPLCTGWPAEPLEVLQEAPWMQLLDWLPTLGGTFWWPSSFWVIHVPVSNFHSCSCKSNNPTFTKLGWNHFFSLSAINILCGLEQSFVNVTTGKVNQPYAQSNNAVDLNN